MFSERAHDRDVAGAEVGFLPRQILERGLAMVHSSGIWLS